MTNRAAKAAMLIRSSVADAFDAFTNPDKITQFWLSATSGPLAQGATLTWSFMVPGAIETVTVTEFRDQRSIGFRWSDGVTVAIAFEEQGGDAVRVSVEATGFKTDPDASVEQIVNATEGFSIVLCDLKTLLETGKSANLVRDKAALIASSLGESKA
jgi:uncharacterized protein YndB with AHSA1/START domain